MTRYWTRELDAEVLKAEVRAEVSLERDVVPLDVEKYVLLGKKMRTALSEMADLDYRPEPTGLSGEALTRERGKAIGYNACLADVKEIIGSAMGSEEGEGEGE